LPVQAWRQELASLQQEYKAEYEQYKPIRADLWKLQQVKRCTDTALHQQEQHHERLQKVER
ncbi:MAG: mobilization protein, partial [Oscillospiraceae bacterium]|nr:mobilization protein [Oscillospiraceae bacterium]